MSTAEAAIIEATLCEESSHQELNRTKGFLGATLGEVTDAVPPEHQPSLAEIKAMTNDALVLAGERAMQDIGDNLLVLDELRQRFRRGINFKGYAGWQDFVAKNSRYSIKTIQNRLAAKNGKDESKVNRAPGNMYTRSATVPNDEQGSGLSKPVLKRLEAVNPEVATRVRAGSLTVRTPKPKAKIGSPFATKDYFARIGRGLATAFSDVDYRLNDIARIKKSEWTPEAEEGIRCLLLNLKEVSKAADAYAARLKAVLRKHGGAKA
jgi:hypothetical protein